MVALGVSLQTVISIERGRFDPSLPLAFLTAQTFGYKIEDVFTAEGTAGHPLPLSVSSARARTGTPLGLASGREPHHDGEMHFAGVLPADAPDPRLKMAEALKDMPIPVVEFVEQRSLEVTDVGMSSAFGPRGYSAMTVGISATLWRNPDDKSDPVNLAELDEMTRRAVEEIPPWPRPGWLIERVEQLRYPSLWEAVQTTWNREESEFTTLEYLLVHHTNYILMNQFREQLQLDLQEWDSPALTSERAVRQGVSVVIDGELVTGAEIDTDPFVYAIGAKLANGGTLTAVIPREHLAYIDLQFARRK